MEQVCIVGSGNWGTAISKIIGQNVYKHQSLFHPIVKMWVFEEEVQGGRKLSEVINQEHENIKYLPGIKLPSNVVAIPSLEEAARNASILVFVLPHQFIDRVIPKIAGLIAPNCRGISLIKGVDFCNGQISLISSSIGKLLGIDVSVLMGANIANEVAKEQFCESTLGYNSLDNAQIICKLFHSATFRVTCVPDVAGVELCGALKNIVAVAAGFSDGLATGGNAADNTKAAVIRLGLVEMKKFCRLLFPSTQEATFFESCGIADLVTSCLGGRNRRIGREFAIRNGGQSIEQLEAELLDGQKLQGPDTAKHVYELLRSINKTTEFPLFSAVYLICFEGAPVAKFFDMI